MYIEIRVQWTINLCIYSVYWIMSHHKIMNRTLLLREFFCDTNITIFFKYLMNESWDIVYTEGAQKAFTWFQGVMDLFFDNSFQKRILTMTYRNRFNWMTKNMRTQIT